MGRRSHGAERENGCADADPRPSSLPISAGDLPTRRVTGIKTTKLKIPTSRRSKSVVYQMQVESRRERACHKEEVHPSESEFGNYQTHFSISSRLWKVP
jgi:hypothetical protein